MLERDGNSIPGMKYGLERVLMSIEPPFPKLWNRLSHCIITKILTKINPRNHVVALLHQFFVKLRRKFVHINPSSAAFLCPNILRRHPLP